MALRTVSLRILIPEANAAPAPLAAPPPAANDEPGPERRKRFVVHRGGRSETRLLNHSTAPSPDRSAPRREGASVMGRA